MTRHQAVGAGGQLDHHYVGGCSRRLICLVLYTVRIVLYINIRASKPEIRIGYKIRDSGLTLRLQYRSNRHEYETMPLV